MQVKLACYGGLKRVIRLMKLKMKIRLGELLEFIKIQSISSGTRIDRTAALPWIS